MTEDAVFNIPTPILFAHRGGVREVPESTWEAFEHAAINAKVDVLELDVQLTEDNEIVVWHGPGLDNVWIDGLTPSLAKRKQKEKRDIMQFRWGELKDRAWVIEPKYSTVQDIEEEKVKKIPKRQLMLLSEFLDKVNRLDRDEKKMPLNIEMKGEKIPYISSSRFLNREIMRAFVELLESRGNGRTIVVASTKKRVLNRFVDMGGRFPINVSMSEQFAYLTKVRPWYLRAAGWLLQVFPSIRRGIDFRGRAFQTSHHLLTQSLVDEVHKGGAAIHVFLSGFAFLGPLIQDKITDEQVLRTALFKLLETGVDGIMTDYPLLMRNILNEWKSSLY